MSAEAPPASGGDADVAGRRRLLTVDEVRAELNIGRSLAYRLVWSGALPVVKVGHALRVRRRDLDAYLEANLSSRAAG